MRFFVIKASVAFPLTHLRILFPWKSIFFILYATYFSCFITRIRRWTKYRPMQWYKQNIATLVVKPMWNFESTTVVCLFRIEKDCNRLPHINSTKSYVLYIYFMFGNDAMQLNQLHGYYWGISIIPSQEYCSQCLIFHANRPLTEQSNGNVLFARDIDWLVLRVE